MSNSKSKKSLKTKAKKPIKFAIVGVLNTILDFGLMNLFKILGLPTVVANTISTGIAMVFSFFMNKKWTFRNAGKNYVRQVVLFFLSSMFSSWVVQNGCIQLIEAFAPRFGLSDQLFANVAKAFASIPSLISNYLLYNHVVFKEEPEDKEDKKENESKKDED